MCGADRRKHSLLPFKSRASARRGDARRGSPWKRTAAPIDPSWCQCVSPHRRICGFACSRTVRPAPGRDPHHIATECGQVFFEHRHRHSRVDHGVQPRHDRLRHAALHHPSGPHGHFESGQSGLVKRGLFRHPGRTRGAGDAQFNQRRYPLDRRRQPYRQQIGCGDDLRHLLPDLAVTRRLLRNRPVGRARSPRAAREGQIARPG